MMRWGILLVALMLAACGRDESRGASDSARGEVTTPDTGMAGMDHSKMPGMGAAESTPAVTSMAGKDHANMPGMGATGTGRVTGSMPGMDHSRMAMPASPAPSPSRRTTQPVMDHANMPGMNTPSAGAQPRSRAAAVDHANMPGMSATSLSATDMKLDELVARLLRDSVVRSRIQTDTALKRRWDEAARRTLLLNNPR